MEQNRIVTIACRTLVAITIFSVGYLSSNLISTGISYKNEVSFSDILNIGATCLATIFAAWYISKKLNEDRYAKELIINDLRKIESSISNIVSAAQNPANGNRKGIVEMVNQLHGSLSRLERTCGVNGKKVPIKSIMHRFYCFYGCATNFGDEPLNIPLIVSSGDDLIVEIRTTITQINQL